MGRKAPKPKTIKFDVHELDREELKKAIILREVLGPPKALEGKMR